MYLKALEIQGFKSFPDKTVLTFGSDITAIVGPNGSGKSNISDALRWVMGEMSTKALRGGKMEDVIFGGTLKRPQVGYAEVSLIIDNSSSLFPLDTAEVMVTRRYFRSGDSEYYINRQAARLKDIVELFMDTGLGREGYSQIGQGKIDEIISVKSVERREVFEEAAGISKYRHRKEESERKLKNTQDNLTRINDKIDELALSVEPLRDQAEKAKRYLILRDELRSLEVTVWLDALSRHKSTAAKAVGDFETSKNQSEAVQRELDGLYVRSEEVTAKMRQVETDADGAREEISALEAQIAELESSAAVAKTNLENNQNNLEKLRRDLAEQDGRSGSIAAQLEAKNARLAKIEQDLSEKEAQREKAAKQAQELSTNAGSVGEMADAVRAAMADKLSIANQTEAEISNLAGSAQELYDRQSAMITELTQLTDRKAQAAAEHEAASKALSDGEALAQSLKNTVSGYELRLKSRSAVFETRNQELMKLTVDKQSLMGRINMLEEMERDFEGYNKSVKLIMSESASGRLKNIFGPVSKLLSTPDQYAIAIETALGGSLQSIVVATEEDGKTAIELLKRRQSGRATFLPVSVIKGSRLNESGLDDQPGFEGIASDLIKSSNKFENIFKNLLGRTVIASDMDSAIAIARRYSHRFRIVTLDGQVLNSGGSMTGGSTAKNSGILSRANELKRLKGQYELLQQDHQKAQREADEAKRLVDAVSYELSVASDELRQAQDEALRLKGEVSRSKLLCESLEQMETGLTDQRRELERRLEQSAQRIDKLRQDAKATKDEAEKLSLRLEELTGSASELEDQNRRLSDQIAAIRASQAALEAEKSATISSAQELEQLRSAITGDRQDSERAAAQLEQRSAELIAQLTAINGSLESTSRAAEEKRASLKALIDQKLQLEGERTRLDRAAQEKNRELLVVERETARLEQKKAAAEMEEKQIIDRLWENYELTVTSAEAIRLTDISASKANRRISEIKKEISSLGTPNIGAIEEFERVNSRYEFLTTQRDDVQTAKAELEAIISNITDQMKVIFAHQFKLINDSFAQTFAEMFGGGNAELVLEDEHDILDCGIEIKVQPPGKQVKTITLLSGGEKAFVAIALYFAILKVSPTPFCIMDEIDAALDDNNVRRFASYLRRLSDKTQFIVITHRRGTMEEADVLYGVTMQEQGVSKMLTLDLNQMSRQLGVS